MHKIKAASTSRFIPIKINDLPLSFFAEVQFLNGNKICFHESVSVEKSNQRANYFLASTFYRKKYPSQFLYFGRIENIDFLRND